jgi:CelD/BcsL family acetyltransferase involved in cellulose biosynthesis
VSLALRITRGVAALQSPAWNNLLSESQADHIFLRSEWLSAAADVFGGDIVVIEVWGDDALIAAAAFVNEGRAWRFLGKGPCDYLDIVMSRHVSESTAREATAKIMGAVFDAGAHHVLLTAMPLEGATAPRLRSMGMHVTEFRTTPSPTMHMSVAPAAARKKSLKRHTNKLAREGELRFFTLTTAAEIDPRLDGFFEQHVARWAETETPSLFNEPSNREFYCSLVRGLAPTGAVRLLEVVLDETVVAAHLGFVHGGRFTWYKPTYDPAYSKFSPGEVLLKRLIEDAMSEPVDEFDFTVGDEPFKLRFATSIRTVVDLRVDRSAMAASRFKRFLRVKDAVKSVLSENGRWDRLLSVRERLR